MSTTVHQLWRKPKKLHTLCSVLTFFHVIRSAAAIGDHFFPYHGILLTVLTLPPFELLPTEPSHQLAKTWSDDAG